jgi:hypothetical protein
MPAALMVFTFLAFQPLLINQRLLVPFKSSIKLQLLTLTFLTLGVEKARSIRIGSKKQPIFGKRPDTKKAYVTVKKGDVIQIEAFQEVTDGGKS